jgi:apolipoprotein N-acyltransferase
MATFRAVENGLSIYRQTGSGVSLVTDAFGRTLSRVDTNEEAETGNFAGLQMVVTPVSSVETMYPNMGDMIGYVMLVASAGLLLGLLLTTKRRAARMEVGHVSYRAR